MQLEFFPHAEGYVKVSGGNQFNYVYNYTDHLGNVRLSYTKDPATNVLTILEENHYYPFRLKHNNYNMTSRQYERNIIGGGVIISPVDKNAYKYKLNGKEYQDELGLNMYAMDMRQYDPAIGRWVVQDPVVHHNYSPYSAFDNNPVFWSDPSGADSNVPQFIMDIYNASGSGLTTFTNTGNGNFELSGHIPDSFFADDSPSGGGFRPAFPKGGGGPGALFSTVLNAAIDFGMNYNGKSIISGDEFISTIYSVVIEGVTWFSYHEPINCAGFCGGAAIAQSVEIVNNIHGAVSEASIHTHGSESDSEIAFNNKMKFTGSRNFFSGNYSDLKNASGDVNTYMSESNQYGKRIDGYVCTPNGGLLYFNHKLIYKPTIDRYHSDPEQITSWAYDKPVFRGLPSDPRYIKSRRLNQINP